MSLPANHLAFKFKCPPAELCVCFCEWALRRAFKLGGPCERRPDPFIQQQQPQQRWQFFTDFKLVLETVDNFSLANRKQKRNWSARRIRNRKRSVVGVSSALLMSVTIGLSRAAIESWAQGARAGAQAQPEAARNANHHHHHHHQLQRRQQLNSIKRQACGFERKEAIGESQCSQRQTTCSLCS